MDAKIFTAHSSYTVEPILVTFVHTLLQLLFMKLSPLCASLKLSGSVIASCQPHFLASKNPQIGRSLSIIVKMLSYIANIKKWRLQREKWQKRRHSVERKSGRLFNKPRLNYWLRVAVSKLASQSPCLAVVTQSHCNPR